MCHTYVEINKLRGEVETLTSENRRLLDVISNLSSGEEAGLHQEGETEENSGAPTTLARQKEDSESNTARKPGLKDKIKRLFLK